MNRIQKMRSTFVTKKKNRFIVGKLIEIADQQVDQTYRKVNRSIRLYLVKPYFFPSGRYGF